MKKVIMLLLLVFKFSIASFAQTYFAFGVDESKLTLENNANKLVLDEEKLIQPSMRIVYGYENIWAFKIQLEGNPKAFALMGLGVGYRPLHKMNSRFQPMLYGNFGFGGTEDGRTESDAKNDPKSIYYFSPELSLDYFIRGQTALGLYVSNPIIFNTENATIVNDNFTGQLKSGTQLGLILKFFL